MGRESPLCWAGRNRDAVRGMTWGVTPARGDRRWGWPAPLPPPLPLRLISCPGGCRCSFVCAAGHPVGLDPSRVCTGAVAALWNMRCTAVTHRRAGVERARRRVAPQKEKSYPDPAVM
ncbi:hypothetical protein NDU88_001166 [Pleurodeles waltl]|uniref:Uncharacterized protein n=1 Tax=Pleurodeles waltl TaxID=8319 RepID=A0AAV7Q6A2_PLEWA|nr:hypothetical protein NDU88_001166 [Pleurodeles waltl]